MLNGRNKGANANVIINLRRAPITRAQEAAWRTLWSKLLGGPMDDTLASEQSGDAEPKMAKKEQK